MRSHAELNTPTARLSSRPRTWLSASTPLALMLAVACGATDGDDRSNGTAAIAPSATTIKEAKDANPLDLGLAGFAKVLCSAVFVSNREPGEATTHAKTLAITLLGLPEAEAAQVSHTIDHERKVVRTSHGSLTRTAQYYGDQGCVIHPAGENRVFFTPTRVESRLPDAASQPWPMGDAISNEAAPRDVDMARVNRAVDLAFADPEALTTALLVVHRGRIIAERYAPGITKDTQLESWSMGKSLTATLVGRLMQDGHFKLDDPAPVPEWQTPGDPRASIRIADLLRMSSGLRFTREGEAAGGDHIYVYTGAIDAFTYSVSRPLEFPPNTVGRYRNCDPLTLGYIVKRTVTARGEDYLTYPQRALFDHIGIRRQVLETDPYGNFLLTGYDYGTARNWARIGLLYLNGGVWEGKRLLPQELVDFVRTVAPAWKEPQYGGQFWVNGNDAWNLPRDAYFAAGSGGQNTFIVPSHDLVIVRMGHHAGARASREAVRAAQKELLAVIPPNRT
jgi:CubicO group peptidase (beta-lactamase class C family)